MCRLPHRAARAMGGRTWPMACPAHDALPLYCPPLPHGQHQGATRNLRLNSKPRLRGQGALSEPRWRREAYCQGSSGVWRQTKSRFKSGLCHLPAQWPWPGCLNSSRLHFLTCKTVTQGVSTYGTAFLGDHHTKEPAHSRYSINTHSSYDHNDYSQQQLPLPASLLVPQHATPGERC